MILEARSAATGPEKKRIKSEKDQFIDSSGSGSGLSFRLRAYGFLGEQLHAYTCACGAGFGDGNAHPYDA